jgi:hypothetical protein
MALIVIATAATAAPTAKSFSTTASAALRSVRLGLRFVDLQRAAAKFGPVQRRDRFIGLGGIGHFHKPETPGSARLPVRHNADFFHRTVSLKNGS